jgi:hypothetical protein
MISTEIYVEGYKLDLLQDISTEFNYVIDDIVDFGSKNTSYSKTIDIAGTAKNNQIFGFVFDMGNSNLTNNELPNVNYNFNASKSAQCRVFIDKIQIFKGSIRILEIVIDGKTIEYQCSVFGELGGFITELGNKRLTGNDNIADDLDFSTYDHVWTYNNIASSWEASGSRGTANSSAYGSGYYYPLIDYGNVSTLKVDYDVKTFRPALFAKQYLEKILTNSGYDYEFPLLDTEPFKRIIIPHNQKALAKISTANLLATQVVKTYSGSGVEIPIEFTSSSLGDFSLTFGTDFTFSGTTKVLNIDLKFMAYWNVGPNANILVKKNGTTIGSYNIGTGYSMNYVYTNIIINSVTFNNADVLKVTIDWTLGSFPFDLEILAGGDLTLNSTSAELVPYNYGETIQINNVIPKGIFQKDLFLSICKMYNLYVYDDIFNEKKIYIKPYVDFYPETSADALDWSNKIDRSKPLSIKPMSELNARYYQYKYKDDTDTYNENYKKKFNENYADRLYDTAYDFSKDTESVEIIFASSPLIKPTGKDKYVTQILKITDNNTKEQSMDSVIRIMQVQKLTGVTSWKIMNGATILNTYTDYGYAGHLHFNGSGVPDQDINFGAPKELYFSTASYPTTNLFNAYHSEYIAEITDKDSKLLTCSALLNTMDINNLDFSKYIWIDGVLFRLNKIEGFNPMEYNTTKISLLKVIETRYTT